MKIFILQNDRKFITADPENRAVLEDTANQPAGSFYVNIAFVMTVLVVNHFEIIAVKNAYGKIQLLSLVQPFLQVLHIVGKRAFVPNRSQGVNKYFPIQVMYQMFLLNNLLFRPKISQEQ